MSIRKVIEEMERMRRQLETPETLRMLTAADEAMKRFAALAAPTSLTAQLGNLQTITDSIKVLKTDLIPQSMLDMIDTVDTPRIREHFVRPVPMPDLTFKPTVHRQRRLPERTIVRKEVKRRVGFADFE
jgi:hypothetical protein